MINISKFTSEDNTPWLAAPPPRTAAATGAPTRTVAGGLFRDGRDGHDSRDRRSGRDRRDRGRPGPGRAPAAAARILVTAGQILLSWLAAIPRRLGDRLFVMNDTEAYWRSWQITRTHGGLGRRYRDPRFDTLAGCPKCYGTGRTPGDTWRRTPGDTWSRTPGETWSRAAGDTWSRAAGLPCAPCLGTGRITLGEVS